MSGKKVIITFDCETEDIIVKSSDDQNINCQKYTEFALAIKYHSEIDPEFMREMVESYYTELEPDNGYRYH